MNEITLFFSISLSLSHTLSLSLSLSILLTRSITALIFRRFWSFYFKLTQPRLSYNNLCQLECPLTEDSFFLSKLERAKSLCCQYKLFFVFLFLRSHCYSITVMIHSIYPLFFLILFHRTSFIASRGFLIALWIPRDQDWVEQGVLVQITLFFTQVNDLYQSCLTETEIR